MEYAIYKESTGHLHISDIQNSYPESRMITEISGVFLKSDLW